MSVTVGIPISGISVFSILSLLADTMVQLISITMGRQMMLILFAVSNFALSFTTTRTCVFAPTESPNAVLTPFNNVSYRRSLQKGFKMAESSDSSSLPTIEDKNGNPISVGSTVRVARAKLKAYHVPPKAKGTFDEETKAFQPVSLESGQTKAAPTQCLVLPVGLRGVVTNIIGVEDSALSANFPVEVQFVPGEHTDEGYDTPVKFRMHLDTNEIEAII